MTEMQRLRRELAAAQKLLAENSHGLSTRITTICGYTLDEAIAILERHRNSVEVPCLGCRVLMGERLKKLRKQKGLSVLQVCFECHISESTYYDFEQGARFPRPDTLHELSKLFGVSKDYILARDWK